MKIITSARQLHFDYECNRKRNIAHRISLHPKQYFWMIYVVCATQEDQQHENTLQAMMEPRNSTL